MKRKLKITCFMFTLISMVLFYALRCRECSSFYFWWDGEKYHSYGIYFTKTLYSLALFSVLLKDHLARRIYTVLLLFLISNVVYWLYVFSYVHTVNYVLMSLFNVVFMICIIFYLIEHRKTNASFVK